MCTLNVGLHGPTQRKVLKKKRYSQGIDNIFRYINTLWLSGQSFQVYFSITNLSVANQYGVPAKYSVIN